MFKNEQFMETSFVIRKEELALDFVESIKKLFKRNQELQITISSSEDFGLTKKETKTEYFNRLEKAKANLEKGSVISFSEEEFDEFSLAKI